MYQVLDKYTIKNEILPHLSVAKRGFITKSSLVEIVNCTLYKLKSGCQWAMLLVVSLFSEVVLSYKTVFGHFRKWCKNGHWKHSWISLLDKYKFELDMSSVDIDGSHTAALHGSEQIAYKKKKTNSLYLTDRQGIPLALSSPLAGIVYRTVLNRFDRTVSSWSAWNDILFQIRFFAFNRKQQSVSYSEYNNAILSFIFPLSGQITGFFIHLSNPHLCHTLMSGSRRVDSIPNPITGLGSRMFLK